MLKKEIKDTYYWFRDNTSNQSEARALTTIYFNIVRSTRGESIDENWESLKSYYEGKQDPIITYKQNREDR